MGRSVAMPMPDVIGYKIYEQDWRSCRIYRHSVSNNEASLNKNQKNNYSFAFFQHLCGLGVSGSLVEFFGDGIPQ